MTSAGSATPSERLPVRGSLTLAYAGGLAITLLIIFASAIGLAYQRVIYPSNVLRTAFVPSDGFSLIIGLPVLLGSMWLTRRGRLLGLLGWPAACFYVLYVYIPYIIGVPFNVLFLPHLLLVVIGAYSLIGLLAAIDGEAVRQRLVGFVPVKVAAGILVGLGVFTLFRQTLLIIGSMAGGDPVGMLARATFVADFAVLPMLLGAGMLLWRRAPLGYSAGPALLLGFGLLALSLVPFFLVQSSISGQPIDSAGLMVVLGMAGLCLGPFAFFARAAVPRRGQAPT
jgi:hypothetical protein